ncbi:polyprenyl synthetase [Vulcanibacillus modesticaldus]|uniref:Farnesyl diphosphate synthase n=2 Tax=Vulcanibacillus modesticaldus TaxID=337097 RepID=A0A1D2YRX4_9BACI|nr:farnesyl diphosphate synthase [Vulcanibacillus modesticaldus]OEF95558.1 polyprenyl synthetase [Vulcanibacillus modesticaldus]
MNDTNNSIKEYLTDKAGLINQAIIQYLPKNNVPDILKKSMEYSLMAGGKRIRPILALATYESFDKDIMEIIPVVINIELLHTYSLIHDDLPAMDDDDYRRGKLTNHKVFGEAIAILAGDALLTHAFGNMAKELRNLSQVSKDRVLQIIEEFADYAGASGMVGGQVVDLTNDQSSTTFEDLVYTHAHKTGDLIVFSIRLGALLAGANEKQLEALTKFGENIGFAFQIQDDILDVIGDSEKLGKQVGSDQINDKVTYPFFKGIEASKEEVRKLSNEAKDAIKDIGIDTKYLCRIADYLIFREN